MRHPRAVVVAVSALLLAPDVLGGAGHAVAPAVRADVPPRTSAGAPAFTDPLWLPLRRPALVSCVRTNCHKGSRGATHGFWAIDFLGRLGDPVYAAGYGTAHIGARASGCAGGKRKRGNWVWVDHGATELTAYFHLRSISIYDGQRVTPATVLGRMGSSGTCGVPYLHFERRRGGLHGKYLYPQSGEACVRGRPRSYPQALGYRDWDRVPVRPRRLTVWSGGVWCSVAPRPVPTPTRFRVAHNSAHAALLRWRRVGPATRYAIKAEPLQRSTGRWRAGKQQYTRRARTVMRGLHPGVTYRFSIAACRRGANSPWSPYAIVTLDRR